MRDPEMLSIGTIFDDRYVILGVLGAGGFGVVYKAKEVKVFDRLVALKRIHPHLLHDHPAGGERFLEMFEEEARILTLVTHPGVMHLLNWGTDERGVPYIVTEMLRGKALAMPAIPDAASRDEYMTVVTPFLAAMDQLLEILGCCHKEQVIHCDLKPDNVMMQNTYGLGSLARVMDFGIARILTGGGFSRPEDPHGIRITPDFAAPEQFEAKPLTPAVDLYALGCMLNLGLSGAPDYIMADGDTHREWAKKVHHQRRTRETYRPGAPVPDLLASVVECALVSDPGGRFSDAAEFREALREAANQEALELDLPLPFGGTQLVTVVCQEAPDPPGAESVAPPIRTPSVPAQTDPMVVGECVVVFPLDAPDAEAYRAAYERDLLPRLRRLSGEPELLPRLLATSQLAPGRMDEAEMEALEYARLLLWELGRLPEGVNQILHLYAMAGRAVPLLLAGTNPPPELLHLRAHPYGDLGPGAGGREERLERSIEASLGQRWWPRAMMAQWRDRKTTTRLLLAASNHLMRGDDRRALSVMGDLVASARTIRCFATGRPRWSAAEWRTKRAGAASPRSWSRWWS